MTTGAENAVTEVHDYAGSHPENRIRDWLNDSEKQAIFCSAKSPAD
jgi:hypothetical protein